jgi:hypothetical protein
MPPQERAGRAVREPDPAVAVEGEHRDVHFGQHLVEERRGLERLEALRSQRRAEAVRLQDDVAQSVALAPVPPADRVVAASQGFEEIRDRAQRLDGRLVHGDRESGPGADQDHDQETVHGIRDRRVAQQQEGGEERGRPARERQEHDPRLERQAAPAHHRAGVQGFPGVFVCGHGRRVYALSPSPRWAAGVARAP